MYVLVKSSPTFLRGLVEPTHSSTSSHHFVVAYLHKMTTTSNGLGASPPIPSTPPEMIDIRSSNDDVKLWVYHCLRKNDSHLTDDAAWALASNVNGVGQVVLCYDQEAWEEEVPDWGLIIYISLQQSQKYVVSKRRDFI